MQNPVINIIRNPQKKCCATCRHARLVSYSPHDPLLAECMLQPQQNHEGFPFTVMVANLQLCKHHDWRHTAADIEYRQKKNHVS